MHLTIGIILMIRKKSVSFIKESFYIVSKVN